jgi:mannose-6-phosphate isomerase-like protein (cupin superfamily)
MLQSLTYRDEEITNTRTGQRMIFRKLVNSIDDDCLAIECFNPSSAVKEPEHVHPLQESSFEVISGNMSFSINGETRMVGPGESILIPKGTPHFFWNESGTEVHAMQYFKPALHIASFFRTFFTLARENKLNEKGLPNLFLVAIISLKHQGEIRLVRPPWALQKMLFTFLAPLGKALGYKAP